MIEDMKKHLFGVGEFFSETWNLLMINSRSFLILGIILIGIDFVIGLSSVPLIPMFAGILRVNEFGIIYIVFFMVMALVGPVFLSLGSAYIAIGTQYIVMSHITKREINIRSIFRFALSRYSRCFDLITINFSVTCMIFVTVLISGFTFDFLGMGFFEIIDDFADLFYNMKYGGGFFEIMGNATVLLEIIEDDTVLFTTIFLIASLLSQLLMVRFSFTIHSLMFFDTGTSESYKTSLRTSKGYVIRILKHVIILIIISAFANVFSGSENFIFKIISLALMSFVRIFSIIYMSLVFLNLYYYGEASESDNVNNYHDYEDDFRNEGQFENIDEDIFDEDIFAEDDFL